MRRRESAVLAMAMLSAIAIGGRAAQAQSMDYEYDALGRLTASTYVPGGKTVHYTYDAMGNRVSVSTAAPNSPPVAVNDSYETTANCSTTIYPLINDTDPDSPFLVIGEVTPDPGVTIFNSMPSTFITFTSIEGTKTVYYRVEDGQGGFDLGQITLYVEAGSGGGVSIIC